MRRTIDLSTRLACAAAQRVWCDSFSMRDYLGQARLCSANKIVVLGQGSVNGVDASNTFSPRLEGEAARAKTRTLYGIPASAIVLGYVGRVVGDKGMHELVASWRTLRARYTDLHLLILGAFEAIQ